MRLACARSTLDTRRPGGGWLLVQTVPRGTRLRAGSKQLTEGAKLWPCGARVTGRVGMHQACMLSGCGCDFTAPLL